MKSIEIMKAALAGVVLAGMAACSPDHSAFDQLSVGQLASMMKAEDGVVVCDANGKGVREEFGVIPGAVLLTSYSFDAAELPSDKLSSLVFYCSSERCSAAPRAADRARTAGYENVYVLPSGIKGWVKEGQPVDEYSG